jgi:hypothetical protein
LSLDIRTFGPQAPIHWRPWSKIDFNILEINPDATTSVVLLVSRLADDEASDASKYVLKLFDRRFSKDERISVNLGDYTSENQKSYQDFAQSGTAPAFISNLLGDEYEKLERMSTGEREACVFARTLQLHKTEVTAYSALETLQGDAVPQFIADVIITSDSTSTSFYLQTPGILLEYINGFPLSQMCIKTPENAWGEICPKVIQKLHQISSLGILNEDVRTGNVLLQPLGDSYRVVFIDFTQSFTRDLYYSDADWIEAKRRADEETRIGGFMENLERRAKSKVKGKNVKTYKGNDLPFIYRPSDPYGTPGYPVEYDEQGNEKPVRSIQRKRIAVGIEGR